MVPNDENIVSLSRYVEIPDTSRRNVMNYEEILYTAEGPVGYLTLNNPSKINALSGKMIGEMIHLLTTLSTDESIKVLVIRAAGKHFCAGHDLSEMRDRGMADYKFIFDQCTRMMELIHSLPQPVIASVQGVATAAGCQLAAWCDLVIAEEGARFATPGVKIGLFCTTPMVAITRAIGRKAAMEMLLTGRFFPASEAKELGLINRVVPAADLASETQKLALQIAEASRLVLTIGKQGFYAQVDQPDAAAMNFAKHTITLNLMSEDAQNGIAAFIEKKTPVWKNR
jgi:enoyl-CoA hydratase/carnithine racemase